MPEALVSRRPRGEGPRRVVAPLPDPDRAALRAIGVDAGLVDSIS